MSEGIDLKVNLAEALLTGRKKVLPSGVNEIRRLPQKYKAHMNYNEL